MPDLPELNADMLHRVADAIEAQPENYNQNEYAEVSDCGTRCCIAGWAARLDPRLDWDGEPLSRRGVTPGAVHRAGQRALGLSEREAAVLFDADWHPSDLACDDPTAAEAAAFLRGLADGDISRNVLWSRACW